MIKSNIHRNICPNSGLSKFASMSIRGLIGCALLGYLAPGHILAQGESTVLKGNVNEANFLSGGRTPGLNLRDLNRNRDAFGNSGTTNLPSVGESFEPPAEAFNLPPRQPYTGQVAIVGPPEQNPNPDFGNEQATPGLEANPSFNMSAQQSQFQQSTQANDPDNTPEMQLAWDQWHKRVAASIYEKFNSMAQFAFRYSHPLSCYATYTVTNDGRILNVQLPQKSPNVAFNAMIILVINSMSGQTDILAFPPGSRRVMVNKAGMFTQNYGVQGFKYTTGDRETIRGRQ